MSADRNIYIGHYLRIWMPKEERKSPMGACQYCTMKQSTKFCSECGGKVIFGEIGYLPGICDYCEKVFGNEDGFFNLNIEGEKDYIIVLENRLDTPGCLRLDDYDTEQELPNKDERGDDWQVLMDALTKDGIKYEMRFGIVNYYS